MPGKKIVDEGEVIRWFEEGRTYAWMAEQYREKYNIDTVPSMWGNFRRRHGLDRRLERNDDLIPWAVEKQHRWAYPLMMLRTEGRRRAGLKVADSMLQRLERWKKQLDEDGTVVHYDPETEEGFFYVKRRPKSDPDLIRTPQRKTTQRGKSSLDKEGDPATHRLALAR